MTRAEAMSAHRERVMQLRAEEQLRRAVAEAERLRSDERDMVGEEKPPALPRA